MANNVLGLDVDACAGPRYKKLKKVSHFWNSLCPVHILCELGNQRFVLDKESFDLFSSTGKRLEKSAIVVENLFGYQGSHSEKQEPMIPSFFVIKIYGRVQS
jgi:hypothetical protein